jgi:hypothetical protein
MATTLYETQQKPIRMNYIALTPDGSCETVVDGAVIYRSAPDPGLVDFLAAARYGSPPESVGYGDLAETIAPMSVEFVRPSK